LKTDEASKPKVSIIIVTYNSEKYILKCVDSILKNNYPNLEIIVVDNASSDNTINKLKNYGDKLKIIKNKKNLGFGIGNNLGIKLSTGSILLLINADAYLEENSISELVSVFLKDDKVMIVGPKILYPDTRKIQSAGGIIQKNGLSNHIGYGDEDNPKYDDLKIVDYVTGAIMAIRRKLFEESGLFDPVYFPAYYEETEKCVQARKLNYKVVYSPKSIGYHYESTTIGTKNPAFLTIFHKNRFKFIYRNYSFKDYFSKFLPSEIHWFFKYCPPHEKKIVIKSHLKAIFSKRVFLKMRNPKL